MIFVIKPRFGQLKSIWHQCKLSIPRRYCSNKDTVNEEKEKEIERITKNASLDEPPTACCRSGCSNCVFIVWAEALASKMENAGPEITDKIMKMVDDPSMRAYLEMELRIRLKKK